jgi:hypothetical protein
LDASFNPIASGAVYALGMQPDERILVGGAFAGLGGQSRSRLGRLNGDGTLDAGFNPLANADVYALVLQPDGKILTGGKFTSLGKQIRRYSGRLNPEGIRSSSPGLRGTSYPG